MNDKLGYACINMTLAENNITVNRGMIKKTFDSKGLDYVSELIILNVKDFIEIINWNQKNNIINYRMSSDIFPWFTHYKIEDLTNFKTIKKLMLDAGNLIKKYNHKVSLHPGQFCCLASPKPEVVEKTIYELEQHSELMNLLGLDESAFYNINIHIGGVYGDKEKTLNRFIENFDKLSKPLKKRLTIENDDSKNGYTVQDLFYVYERTNIPIVFDTLHYYCNPGEYTYEDSFNLAYSTWNGIIPEIHHSSSKKLFEDNKKTIKTHADYIYEKVNTCNKDVYVTIESKMKELSIIKYRKDFL
jgi:UV DNA damage endonuclease